MVWNDYSYTITAALQALCWLGDFSGAFTPVVWFIWSRKRDKMIYCSILVRVQLLFTWTIYNRNKKSKQITLFVWTVWVIKTQDTTLCRTLTLWPPQQKWSASSYMGVLRCIGSFRLIFLSRHPRGSCPSFQLGIPTWVTGPLYFSMSEVVYFPSSEHNGMQQYFF